MEDQEESIVIKLTEDDIPGAALTEPLESHTVVALKWWLLCRDIKVPTSWKKSRIIARIREAKEQGIEVVDVDGSYLWKKRQSILAPLGVDVSSNETPLPPPSGWEQITASNYKSYAEKIPQVTAGVVYTYLAEGVGHTVGHPAFRALSRGFTHWASGRMELMEVNLKNPDFCHVRCTMKPSMKPGVYKVYVLLQKEHEYAAKKATCECAAGNSASCTHISAILHALVALCPSLTPFQDGSSSHVVGDTEESLPVTSFLCQWKQPRKRKDSTLKTSEAKFEKHVYSRVNSRSFQEIEDFDPRPQEHRGTASVRLSTLLNKLQGKDLAISLLLDPRCRVWGKQTTNDSPDLPSDLEVQFTVGQFISSLMVSEEMAREIELTTRRQRNTLTWFDARRFRLTASKFGEVRRLKPTTPPDNLVLRVIQSPSFKSAATEWGIRNEDTAIKVYADTQRQSGHDELVVCPSGFIIDTKHAFLGATPDGAVYDPLSDNPYGFLEVKCPYSLKDKTPQQACSSPGFCCTLDGDQQSLHLRENHLYYSQVQGQMAIGHRPWCDFVIYTTKGISVERINFNQKFWEDELLPKLCDFYRYCIAPEIVSPLHVLGLPIRDLRKSSLQLHD